MEKQSRWVLVLIGLAAGFLTVRNVLGLLHELRVGAMLAAFGTADVSLSMRRDYDIIAWRNFLLSEFVVLMVSIVLVYLLAGRLLKR